jgi:hypothetical protein
MKWVALAAAAVVSAWAVNASAATIISTYTGTISVIADTTGLFGPGANISVGDPFMLVFTASDAVPNVDYTNDGVAESGIQGPGVASATITVDDEYALTIDGDGVGDHQINLLSPMGAEATDQAFESDGQQLFVSAGLQSADNFIPNFAYSTPFSSDGATLTVRSGILYSYLTNSQYGLNFSSVLVSSTGDPLFPDITTSGVPEPQAWTVMLLGFGLIGLAFRGSTNFGTKSAA